MVFLIQLTTERVFLYESSHLGAWLMAEVEYKGRTGADHRILRYFAGLSRLLIF